MQIDVKLIEQGIKTEMIASLIKRHKDEQARFNKLSDYYGGNHDILRRSKATVGAPNNKLVANFAKYITDMSCGYLLSVPVTYSANVNITAVLDTYYKQTIAQKDSEIARDISMYGVGYELVYIDKEAQPKTAIISPKNIFLVTDDTIERDKLFAVHYYRQYDAEGKPKDWAVNVYTSGEIQRYIGGGEDIKDLSLISIEPHYFNAVPVIEYKNNREGQGDFEQLINLIDAYNLLQSDRVNDKEQFVDAILLLTGVTIETEQVPELKEGKILMLPDEAKAEYLTRILDENNVEILRQSLEQDIHKFSMVPNLADLNFAGNSSGVAIRYKLLAFEQSIKNKERYFEIGLKERFSLYNTFLNIKQHMPMVPASEVDVVFTRNLPVNELEVAQMVATLKDIVSDETLLGQIPFVTDPGEELKIVEAQKEREHNRLEKSGGFGDYDDE